MCPGRLCHGGLRRRRRAGRQAGRRGQGVGVQEQVVQDQGEGRGYHRPVIRSRQRREVTVTTNGEKETDINLFVKGKYFEAKDTSPGPKCLIKFTPVKGDEKFKIVVVNNGPGANKVTLEVKVAE